MTLTSRPSCARNSLLAAAVLMVLTGCGGTVTSAPEEGAVPDAGVDTPDGGDVAATLAAPVLEAAIPGDAKVTLRWSAGAPDAQYEVRFRSQATEWQTRSAGASTTYDVLPLDNGTSYDFQVRIIGATPSTSSPYSEVRSATPEAAMQADPQACEGASVRHITVTGAGTGDGMTLENAGTMEKLDDFIASVGAGGTVCIHAGTYPTGHSVTRGGTAAAPVTIKGVGGRPVFASTFDATTRAKTGATSFEVRASHLVFENLEFRQVGSCFRFRGGLSVSNVTLSSFRAENTATCVDVERSTDATVTGLTIRNAMIVLFTRGAIFLTSNTSGVVIEDLYVDMQPEKMGGRGSDYPVGIALYNTARDVIIRRATVLNVVGKIDGYTQGDGIDGETTTKDVVVENSYFRGCQDGCIDTKTQNMVIRDTVAVDCKRNYRLWQYASPGPRVENVTSYQPRDAHFFIKGGDTTAVNIAIHSDNASELVAYDCTSTTPCRFNVEGITGTILDQSKVNAASVSGSTLSYGDSVSLPPVPNPTSFQP